MSAEPLRVIDGGAAPRGWEALWQRDVWCQSELPHGDLVSTYRGEEFIHFERIGQPWLKEAAKRWARTRLLADTAPRTMSSYLVGIAYFSGWLAAHAPEVSAPSGLSRAVLEDYMLWVRHESLWKPATRNQRLLAVPGVGGAARGRVGGAAGGRGDPWRGAAARRLPAAQDAPGRGVFAVDQPGEPGAAG